MASVFLEFIAPGRAGFTKLYIYEATGLATPLTLIETVEEIGEYPSYLSSYSTDQATSRDNYFAIQWEDDKGVQTDISSRIKGGTQTLVGKVTERVLQRDSSLDESIVSQEAEAVISEFFDEDPYEVDVSTVSYRVLNGLVYLTMARVYIFSQATETGGFTIGLVSLKSSSVSAKNIERLLAMANDALRINTSVVLQMASLRRHHGHRWVLEA